MGCHAGLSEGKTMFDLENVVDNQTAAEELEEVVMGLVSSILVRRAAAYGALREKRKKAILRRRKR